MDFPTNNYLTSEREVEAILACVARQIADKESNKTFGEDVKARIHGYSNYKPFDGASDTSWFNKDAIRKAIKVIKQHGWRCWEHTDYQSELSIWITASGVRPHPWYKEC